MQPVNDDFFNYLEPMEFFFADVIVGANPSVFMPSARCIFAVLFLYVLWIYFVWLWRMYAASDFVVLVPGFERY